jgi:hypothetical protein
MTIATTGSGSSNSSLNGNSRFDDLISKVKGSTITKDKLRDEVFNILLDDAVGSPSEGKWYIFEYDPKFKDRLIEWDQYPLIFYLEGKGSNVIGANMHYISSNARLSAINRKKFPKSSLRQYIPKNADSIFFEIQESEVQLLSLLPLEKFHRKN